MVAKALRTDAVTAAKKKQAEQADLKPILTRIKESGGGDLLTELQNMAARGDSITALLPAGGLGPVNEVGAFAPFDGAPTTARTELKASDYGEAFEKVFALRTWGGGSQGTKDFPTTELQFRLPAFKVAGYNTVQYLSVTSDPSGKITSAKSGENVW